MLSTALHASTTFSSFRPSPSKPRILSTRACSSSRTSISTNTSTSTSITCSLAPRNASVSLVRRKSCGFPLRSFFRGPRGHRGQACFRVAAEFVTGSESADGAASSTVLEGSSSAETRFVADESIGGSGVRSVEASLPRAESCEDSLLIIAPDGAEVSSEIARKTSSPPLTEAGDGGRGCEDLPVAVIEVNAGKSFERTAARGATGHIDPVDDVGIHVREFKSRVKQYDFSEVKTVLHRREEFDISTNELPSFKTLEIPRLRDLEKLDLEVTAPAEDVIEDSKEKSLGAEMREIVALAGPALGSVIADPLMSLIDTGCVGQQSALELAALGPNTAIFNLVFQVFAFIGVATTNVIASKLPSAPGISDEEREQRKVETGTLMSNALLLALVSGVACCIIMEAVPHTLLYTMGASPEMMTPALTYLKIRALASPAVMVMCAAQGACLGQQDAWTPLKIFVAAGLVNLVADVYLIMYNGYGIAGAAWATLFAQYLGAAAFVAVLYCRGRKNGIRLHFKLPTLSSFEPYMAMASALAPGAVVRMTGYAILTCKATLIGTVASAAHQVGLQVFRFLAFVPEPLSITAQSLIARDLGKRVRVQRLARTLLTAGIAAGVLLGLVVVGIFEFLPWLFTSDVQVVSAIQNLCPQAFFSVVTLSTIMVMDGVAIGSGDFSYLPQTSMLATAGCWIAAQYCTGIGSVWWSLLLFFGLRLLYHAGHVLAHWATHPLGSFKVKSA